MSEHVPSSPPYPHEPPYIMGDDRKGIIWLYKHVYEGQPFDDCFFPEYIFEHVPGQVLPGCRPKHPLIFEVKYGNRSTPLRVLEDDPTLDVNAQDDIGRTALHYAVEHGEVNAKREQFVKQLLPQPNIDPRLRDKQGGTALDIAKELGWDNFAARIGHHPLMQPEEKLSVNPRGKKMAVMWGELKHGN